jgi:hypothetical protein
MSKEVSPHHLSQFTTPTTIVMDGQSLSDRKGGSQTRIARLGTVECALLQGTRRYGRYSLPDVARARAMRSGRDHTQGREMEFWDPSVRCGSLMDRLPPSSPYIHNIISYRIPTIIPRTTRTNVTTVYRRGPCESLRRKTRPAYLPIPHLDTTPPRHRTALPHIHEGDQCICPGLDEPSNRVITSPR